MRKAALGALAALASLAAVPAAQAAGGQPPPQTGFMEICKNSDKVHPVTGMFQFQVTGPNGFQEQVPVPVGACSLSFSAPAGVPLNVQEEGSVDVTAISAIPSKNLVSDDLSKANATVTVVAGDLSHETIVTFTNQQVPGTSLVKVCKNAGNGIQRGQMFAFQVGSSSVMVPAGFCVIAQTDQSIGTIETVSEKVPAGDQVARIQLAGGAASQGLDLANGSIKVRIGTGVNEVVFTNMVKGAPPPPPPPPPPPMQPPPPPPPPVKMPVHHVHHKHHKRHHHKKHHKRHHKRGHHHGARKPVVKL